MAKTNVKDRIATEDLGRKLTRVKVSRGVLVVVEGPQPGRRVGLEAGSLIIGSSPDAGLDLADRSVSDQHARLSAEEGRLVLRDLGSTNGTLVNGCEIREAYLNEGDLVQLGRCRLRFESEVMEVRVPPSTRDGFGPAYGRSLAMRRVFGVLERVAAEATVPRTTPPTWPRGCRCCSSSRARTWITTGPPTPGRR